MIGPNDPAPAGAMPESAATPACFKPKSGAWARLRVGSPWLEAFPAAWVPVKTLMPKKVPGAVGESAWDLAPERCTILQKRNLAAVLERSGKGAAQFILAGITAGHRVAIGAGHFAFVEDFTTHKRCCWSELPATKGQR